MKKIIYFAALALAALTFMASAESGTTTLSTTTNDLPHYIKVKDFSGSNVILEDYSLDLKSTYYKCGIDNKQDQISLCTTATSSAFEENSVKPLGLVSPTYNNDNTFGIAYKKSTTTEMIISSSTTTSSVGTSPATATEKIVDLYNVYTFSKDINNSTTTSSSTGIVFKSAPSFVRISDNKIAVFVFDNFRYESYDLSTGKKISESVLVPEGLDKLDGLSSIYFANISSDGKYLAWYIPFTSSRPYITYGFTEVSTGKTITRKEDVKFDRVARSGNVFQFSEDNKYAYFISGKSGYNTIWKLDIEKTFEKGSEVSEKLFSKDYTITNFVVNHNDIYFVGNRDSATVFNLYRFNTKNNKLDKLNNFNVSPFDNIKIYKDKVFYNYVFNNLGVNSAYYDIMGKFNYYFPVNLNSNSKIDAAKYSYIKNTKNNTVLGVPDTFNQNSDTLLVFLHGGPYNQVYTTVNPNSTYGTFDWLLESARKNGMYVAKLDYPGSFGYGVDYVNSLLGGIGSVDMKAMRDSIAAIKDQNKNIKKVQLVGISYGGYMVVKDYVDNSSDYNQVYALAPVTDWYSEYETGTYSFFNSHFGIFGTSTPTTTPEILALYKQANILDKVSNLPTTTVLSVYQGTKDYSVDPNETKAFDKAMKDAGKDYKITFLEGQPHVFNKRSIWSSICTDIVSKLIGSNTSYCALKSE